ncbi:hypothetical protein F4781DRAFT_283509 [Annulohypoxylon bovei var. microspora]|nr:hypothetical protein F4781DRAFT_283509 [Annulohypoxylon bovei var. microspora]
MARLFDLFGAVLLGVAHAEQYLNLTTLTAKNNVSVIECWQLSTPFTTSDTPGVVGLQMLDMGGVVNATYTVIPGRFDGGLHNAPFKQWVWFVSGVISFSLPNGTDTALVYGGRYGLLLADDTKDISAWGHETTYPGADEVIIISIPIQNNVTPEHSVLHSGACTMDEQVAI